MDYSIICFTKKGLKAAKKVSDLITKKGGKGFELYVKSTRVEECDDFTKTDLSVSDWASEAMRRKRVLLFVGACGIAIRAIAPHIESKLSDSPVLVVDEDARFVIPLLSGHYGRANEIAKRMAADLGAIAVVTTATDINEKFAIDVFARKNGLAITDKDSIKVISSKILAGERIVLAVDNERITEDSKIPDEVNVVPRFRSMYDATKAGFADERVDVTIGKTSNGATMHLKPLKYVVGVGCRKDTDPAILKKFVDGILADNDIDISDVLCIASIDLKADERALIDYSNDNKLPFFTFTSDELQRISGEFTSSVFVKETTGVDNVCERAAICACNEYEDGAELILKKVSDNGITAAIAKRDWRIKFYGE